MMQIAHLVVMRGDMTISASLFLGADPLSGITGSQRLQRRRQGQKYNI
jgi:hypothetical protein